MVGGGAGRGATEEQERERPTGRVFFSSRRRHTRHIGDWSSDVCSSDSLWLVLLSTFLTPICVLISWNHIQSRVKEFYAFLLLLEVGLVGVFLAQDLFLFYVFWEVSLVPMYFLIGIWGHDRRIY